MWGLDALKPNNGKGVICGPCEALEMSPAVFNLTEITCILCNISAWLDTSFCKVALFFPKELIP